MRKLLICCLLLAQFCLGLERQPNADYHARRVALSQKVHGAIAVLFAPMEAEGPNAIYGYRPDDNFYYLTGWTGPDAAVLIAPPAEGTKDSPAHPYTEILFLPARNYVEEKWTGPKLGPEDPQVRQITGFDRVEALDKLRDEINHLVPPRAT